MRGKSSAVSEGNAKMCHVSIQPLERTEGLYHYSYCDGTGLHKIEVPDDECYTYSAELDIPPGIMVFDPLYKGGVFIFSGDAEVVDVLSTASGRLDTIYVYGDCVLQH